MMHFATMKITSDDEEKDRVAKTGIKIYQDGSKRRKI